MKRTTQNVLDTPNLENTSAILTTQEERATSPLPSSQFSLETKEKQRTTTPNTSPKLVSDLGKSSEILMDTPTNSEIDQQGAETCAQPLKLLMMHVHHQTPTCLIKLHFMQQQTPIKQHIMQQQIPIKKITKKSYGLVFLHKKNGAHQHTRSQPQSGAQNRKMRMQSSSALWLCMRWNLALFSRL